MVFAASFSAQGQFINPVTPDIIIGSCQSTGVENSGTSVLGDWQVVVVDGSQPSIIFYNHATGQEDCHLLYGAQQGFTITDPDVVWNYGSNQDIYVVYKLSGAGPLLDGIWAERWLLDASLATISPDVATYFDPVNNMPPMAQLYNSSTAEYPNIDYHLTNDEVVVVWEDQGTIIATSEIQNPLLFSAPFYDVNSFCTGYTLPGTQPDVAMGYDKKVISFTYKQLNGGTNEIVVRQDAYVNILGGNPTNTCVNETMVPPVGFDDVNFPRISAPKFQFGRVTSFDCNVTYEVLSSAGENFIGSSTYKFENFSFPGAPNCPLVTIYNTPFRWSHDIVNANGVGAWSNMNADLRFDPNSKPVSVYGGDLVYNSWNWHDQSGIRILGLDEVLTVATKPNSLSLVSQIPNPAPCDTTSTYNVVAYALWSDYLVTGEAYLTTQNQNVVSSASDGGNLVFAFYQPSTSEVIIKKAAMPGSPFIRKGRPEDVAIASENQKWTLNVFPNPSNGEFKVRSSKSIQKIGIYDLAGKLVQEMAPNKTAELTIALSVPGIYQIQLTADDGERSLQKVVVVQ
jgi:hypothetical protein